MAERLEALCGESPPMAAIRNQVAQLRAHQRRSDGGHAIDVMV